MSRTVAEENTRKPVDVPAPYRYGILVMFLVLLGWELWVFAHAARPYKDDPYGTIVVTLALLAYHLAFNFPWRRSHRIALRAVALCWFAFAGFYAFYWDDVLFPP